MYVFLSAAEVSNYIQDYCMSVWSLFQHFVFLSGTGSFRPIQTRLAPSSRQLSSKALSTTASPVPASQLSSKNQIIN